MCSMFSMLIFYVAHCMNGEDAKSEQVQICLRFWDFRVLVRKLCMKTLKVVGLICALKSKLVHDWYFLFVMTWRTIDM